LLPTSGVLSTTATRLTATTAFAQVILHFTHLSSPHFDYKRADAQPSSGCEGVVRLRYYSLALFLMQRSRVVLARNIFAFYSLMGVNLRKWTKGANACC
jgi:hypothetical protein